MAKHADERLQELEHAIGRAKETATAAGDTVISVSHRGVPFGIGRHFVSANLEPLQFFHLVEHIGIGSTGEAIVRLYERLSPLLTCRHQWTDLKRTSDAHAEAMVTNRMDMRSRPQICRLCTAYTLTNADQLPPVVGMF